MMSKILLIYDDYTELNAVQFTLKKVGFDCLGISTEFGTTEKVISFNPDIVVASGRGPKVTTVGVGRRLKDMPRWTGKAVLIFPQGNKPKPEDLMKIRMDVVLEAPIETVRLIQVLAKLTNQDDQVLIEKLIKTMAQESTAKENTFIVGNNKPAADTVYVGGSAGESKKDDPVIPRFSDRNSDPDLTFKAINNQPPEPEASRTKTFAINPTENISQQNDPSLPNSAFDDLNRREQARVRRRPEFSLKPEDPTEEVPKHRFEGPQATVAKGEARIREQQELQLKKQAESESSQVADLPIDKEEVNWADLESQLFSPSSAPAGSNGVSEVPLPLPESELSKFEQQVRSAEKNLPGKMKEYQQMSGSLKLPKESTMKKTNSRKAQIELMKDWKQVELDKQDGLRREFTKALFKKK